MGILKKLLLGMLSRVFGLNITEAQLDAFIEFIKLLIGAFGGAAQAANYTIRMVQLSNRMPDKKQMRAVLDQAEVHAKQVVQG